MKHSIYIVLLAIALLLASCEKAIDFRGDEQSPVVVVVSEPEPDNALAVRLTYSRFFLSGRGFRVIGNADVKAVVGGATYTAVFNDSAYVFPYSPSEGDSIALTVRMQNGGVDTVLTATTRMPYRPSVTVRENSGDLCHFTLNDRPGEKNHYRLRILTTDTVVELYDREGYRVYDPEDTSIVRRDTVEYTGWCFFGCSDAALTANVSSTIDIEDEDNYNVLFFTDELFDGQSRDITIRCDGYSTYDDYEYYKQTGKNTRKSDSRTLTLYIESLSRETYLYELSLYKQDDGDIFLTEPVQVQGNIVGGLGIFGAKAASVVKLPRIVN